MTNSKLEAALDELERLRDTVRGFRERNKALPNEDSDAGRAVSLLKSFLADLHKLDIERVLKA